MTTSEALYDRAARVLPGGNTRSTLFVAPNPPYAVSGSGAVVVDSDGHRCLDFNNNYTALIHGHADPEVLAVTSRVAQSGTAFGLPTEHEIEMAELLRARSGFDHWRFCNSGTEAVMMLIRAARAFTGRDLIIRFEGSYHGTYDGVVDPRALGVPSALAETFLVLPQGDEDALRAAMQQHGDRVAAILLDLMPNRAGLIPADGAYVRAARELATEHGALLAVDEVITFRLSTGGLHRTYGVTADLISIGKVIGGGFPVGAVGGRPEVLRSFSPLSGAPVSWGGTFSANPMTMVAGISTLTRFDESAVTELNDRGDGMRQKLIKAGVRVNGRGSLMRLVTSDTATLWWELYRNGVLAGTNGLLSLSTAMTQPEIDAATETLAAVGSRLAPATG